MVVTTMWYMLFFNPSTQRQIPMSSRTPWSLQSSRPCQSYTRYSKGSEFFLLLPILDWVELTAFNTINAVTTKTGQISRTHTLSPWLTARKSNNGYKSSLKTKSWLAEYQRSVSHQSWARSKGLSDSIISSYQVLRLNASAMHNGMEGRWQDRNWTGIGNGHMMMLTKWCSHCYTT